MNASGAPKRSVRVAERVRDEIAAAIRELRDPRLVGALVSRVELTDDLGSAKVYVRREVEGDRPEVRRQLLRGLEAAGGRLRGAVARAVALRHVPTLRFYYDESGDAVARVEELLREISAEGRPGRGEGGEGGG